MFFGEVEAPLALGDGAPRDAARDSNASSPRARPRPTSSRSCSPAGPRPCSTPPRCRRGRAGAAQGPRSSTRRGVASYAAPRYYALLQGPRLASDDDLLLELKRVYDGAVMPGLSRLPSRPFADNGARVVALPAARAPAGDPTATRCSATPVGAATFRVRDRSKFQRGLDLEGLAEKLAEGDWSEDDIAVLADQAGRLLARAHAGARRQSGPLALPALAAAIAGDPGGLVAETLAFVRDYAPIVEADYQRFLDALTTHGPALGYPHDAAHDPWPRPPARAPPVPGGPAGAATVPHQTPSQEQVAATRRLADDGPLAAGGRLAASAPASRPSRTPPRPPGERAARAARRELLLDPEEVLQNQWPAAPYCNLDPRGKDACRPSTASCSPAFAAARWPAAASFLEFALDRAESGTQLWWRPHWRLDTGVATRIEAVRSAGPQSLIGIDGNSLVMRLGQAYGTPRPTSARSRFRPARRPYPRALARTGREGPRHPRRRRARLRARPHVRPRRPRRDPDGQRLEGPASNSTPHSPTARAGPSRSSTAARTRPWSSASGRCSAASPTARCPSAFHGLYRDGS